MNTRKNPHWAFSIILSAVFCFLGLLLSEQFIPIASYSALLQPAAGIALAALFLFNPLVSVGIFIGYLLHQFSITTQPNFLIVTQSLIPMFQALITYKLLRHYNPPPFLLISESNILKFFILVAISSLFSSVLLSAAFYAQQEIQPQQLFSYALTQWISHSFGVYIFTPMILSLVSNHPEWKQRKLSIGFTLAALIALSLLIHQLANEWEKQQLSNKLLQTNQLLSAHISRELERYQQNLQAINIFFLSTYHATPKEIGDFLHQLNLRKDSYTYGYGWFGFADLINKTGDTQYQFHELNAYQHTLKQPPITVIQKQYDECAIGSYLESYENAPQNTLYRNIEASISNIENLCASKHLGGIAYVDTNLYELVSSAAKKAGIQKLKIQLTDTRFFKSNLLFEQSTKGYVATPLFHKNPHAEQLITYKNLYLKLRLEAGKDYILANTTMIHWWVLFFSLMLASIASLGLLKLTSKRLRTEISSKLKTVQLELSNNQLSNKIKQQNISELLINMQTHVLNMIVEEAPLNRVFDQICILTENQIFNGAVASVNMLQQHKLTVVSAPSLSEATKKQFNRLSLEDKDNPCIAAIQTGKNQIIENIESLDNSDHLLLMNLTHNIKAYWSMPILGHRNNILGTFRITQLSAALPNSIELKLIHTASSLASLAVERYEIQNQLYKLSNAVKSSPNGLVIASKEGIIEYANPYFCEYIGYSESLLIGKMLSDFVQDAKHNQEQDFDWDYSLSLGESQRSYMGITPKGKQYWCKQTIAYMNNDDEKNSHVLSIHQDITHEHSAQEQANQEINLDPLTGLFNRTEFERRLSTLIQSSSFNAKHATVLIELDAFKTINEHCGFAASDQFLRSVSPIIKKQLRRSDSLARFESDQFAIIFEQCEIKKVEQIALKLLTSLDAFQFNWQGQSYELTSNIGIVEINSSDTNTDIILAQAHAACSIAKKQLPHIYIQLSTAD